MENTTAPNSVNPLAKYFRQPAIYIKLPSGGKYWDENALELPANGEIPVYPLTTRDEITLRTPDALMNGNGVVDVIQSCCPSIKNAWNMPSIDVDAVLIAIRIASYGQTMDIETKCPACSESNTHAMDLSSCLVSIKSPDYDKLIEIDELKIKLRPQPYFGANKVNAVTFEEQKMMQALENITLTEEAKALAVAASMSRLIDINLSTVSESTDYVEIADGIQVRDQTHIIEFYKNAKSSIVQLVKDRINKASIEGGVPPQPAVCHECSADYKVPLVFDYANFFARGF
jgi:hypothetical protein